ncbi:MAG: hypothetical protein JNK17_15895 [Hydrogenophaga sp.]|nr:hypothetical protein [Hydrogenophaga sp.]
MQPIRGFSLEAHTGDPDTWPETSALLFEGRSTGVRIAGYQVEAQYHCRHGFLLITSFDCPYEESSHFVLLDPRFRSLATAELGALYGSLLLHAHWPLDEDSLQLHYQMRRFYRLRVRPPKPLLRRGFALRVERDERAWDEDPRAKASVQTLERAVAVQRQDAIVDPVPVTDLEEGLSALPEDRLR